MIVRRELIAKNIERRRRRRYRCQEHYQGYFDAWHSQRLIIVLPSVQLAGWRRRTLSVCRFVVGFLLIIRTKVDRREGVVGINYLHQLVESSTEQGHHALALGPREYVMHTRTGGGEKM